MYGCIIFVFLPAYLFTMVEEWSYLEGNGPVSTQIINSGFDIYGPLKLSILQLFLSPKSDSETMYQTLNHRTNMPRN